MSVFVSKQIKIPTNYGSGGTNTTQTGFIPKLEFPLENVGVNPMLEVANKTIKVVFMTGAGIVPTRG